MQDRRQSEESLELRVIDAKPDRQHATLRVADRRAPMQSAFGGHHRQQRIDGVSPCVKRVGKVGRIRGPLDEGGLDREQRAAIDMREECLLGHRFGEDREALPACEQVFRCVHAFFYNLAWRETTASSPIRPRGRNSRISASMMPSSTICSAAPRTCRLAGSSSCSSAPLPLHRPQTT